MARRARKMSKDRDSRGIEPVSVSFTCANCGTRLNTSLMFIPAFLLKGTVPRLESIGRCIECNEQYRMLYRTKKIKGLYRLKVFEFVQCNARHRKRFRVNQGEKR